MAKVKKIDPKPEPKPTEPEGDNPEVALTPDEELKARRLPPGKGSPIPA